jgi:hypothetical protein
MAHWRHPPPTAPTLPFGLWWAVAEAFAVLALLAGLKISGVL